jgi:hypothetical protein
MISVRFIAKKTLDLVSVTYVSNEVSKIYTSSAKAKDDVDISLIDSKDTTPTNSLLW